MLGIAGKDGLEEGGLELFDGDDELSKVDEAVVA